MTSEATIYIGTPEALQAEIGLLPCYEGPFIVAAFNAAGEQVTPESGLPSKALANAVADELKAWLESEGEIVQIAWIN